MTPEDAFDIRLVEQIVAHIFPRSSPPVVQRVQEGVSTCVYRIYRAGELFYLRVLPEVGASFAPEVYVHEHLRARQVKVPEVLHFEHCNEALQRSIMLTTEIKGEHPAGHFPEEDLRAILFEAGRDLAVINSLPVKHFGWVKRDKPEVPFLEAEFSSFREFIYEYLESDLALLASLLRKAEITTIYRVLEDFAAYFDSEQASLAHGDFDVTHIYHHEGRYNGIIDFGEIRGANALYDLGHFSMHEGETLLYPALPYLLEGYRTSVPLSSSDEQQIYLSSLLIAIRALARAVQKGRDVRNHQSLQSIPRDLKLLRG